MQVAYHEVRKDSLDSILGNGLKCAQRGDKSDGLIARTDQLLDSRLPNELRMAGLSRQRNLYCYLAEREGAVNITDGRVTPPDSLSATSDHVVLEIMADPSKAYVSDLDRYDAVKVSVAAGDGSAGHHADEYWKALTRWDQYSHERGFRRPELMVTYDIPPEHIRPV